MIGKNNIFVKSIQHLQNIICDYTKKMSETNKFLIVLIIFSVVTASLEQQPNPALDSKLSTAPKSIQTSSSSAPPTDDASPNPPDIGVPVVQSIFTILPHCQPGYILVGTRCRKAIWIFILNWLNVICHLLF